MVYGPGGLERWWVLRPAALRVKCLFLRLRVLSSHRSGSSVSDSLRRVPVTERVREAPTDDEDRTGPSAKGPRRLGEVGSTRRPLID